jgi:hypothetical protein
MWIDKFVKNNSEAEKTWAGRLLQPGEYYRIQEHGDNHRFANDVDFLQSLLNDQARMSRSNSELGEIISPVEAINFLKGVSDPQNTDGRKVVHSTPRKRGLSTCFVGAGDDQTDDSKVGGSDVSLMELHHQISDPTSQVLYLDFNTIANETMAHAGHMMWKGALNDTITLETVPRITTFAEASNTFFNLFAGYLIIPAAGDGTIIPTNIKLVEVPVNEFGNRAGAGYWDATYNTATKQFENLTANIFGTGRFNMFVAEVVLDRFMNRVPMLGDGMMNLDTYDASQIGHGMRVKITLETRGEDHEWWWCGGLKPYRRRTC